tara:strand:- start:164 stop:1048 length:885 start_codon:yes stop_codon:yes gene_type:complete
MKINIIDNRKYDCDTLNDQWVENYDWYRSIDTFHNRFPKNYNFTYWQKINNEISIFITKGIYSVDEISSPIKIAIPSDLREFHGPIYEFIEQNIEKFDRVITYDERLISLFPNKCFPSPAMKPWIWPVENQQVYPKSKLCSFITSTKQMLPGHVFRVEILNHILNNYQNKVSCYGEGHNSLPKENGKIEGLKNYAFSIAMENHQSNYYFSEKLLDVILTGCIPIYWGCKNIPNYFNPEGFLFFNSKEELNDIIKNLNIEEYYNRLDAVKENFYICQKKYIDNFYYFVNEGTEWL